jgi:hypothetical protein
VSQVIKEVDGIEVGSYSLGLGKGLGYQVTWGWRDTEYALCENEQTANSLVEILLNSRRLRKQMEERKVVK